MAVSWPSSAIALLPAIAAIGKSGTWLTRVLRCRYVPQADLLAGQWADGVEELLAQPPAAERANIDGAQIAADEILNLLTG